MCWSDGENVRRGRRRRPCRRGVLEHLPAASLLLNLTINSYKRLVPGWFAPINVSWGLENRSCALRVIRGDDPTRSRIECQRPARTQTRTSRSPCSWPPRPTASDAAPSRLSRSRATPTRATTCRLPGSLESALAAFRADEGLRAALGDEFSDYYVTSREWELSAWREGVSDWERERYERAV